jgi:hypothetical protein
MTIDNKYIDGLTPYIFSNNKYKCLNISLLGNDKLFQMFIIKNENTNIHKILAGLLDIHLFITKKKSTQMCSYICDHTIIQKSYYISLIIIEKIMIFILFIYYHSINKSNIIAKLIEEYCIS